MATDFTLCDIRIFTGKDIIESGHVVVKSGLISSVSSGPPRESAENAGTIFSRPGHTLLPGLIDAHMHAQDNELALSQSLQFGVTTVHDLHNETANVRKMKALAAAKKDEAADFRAAGVAATIEGGWPMAVVLALDKSDETAAAIATWPKLTSPAEATAFVEHNLSSGGADLTKLMHESGSSLALDQTLPKPSLAIQRALVEATHAAGRVAVAHCLGRADTLEVLSVGVDGLAHTFVDAPVTDDVVEAYVRSGAWCCPTLALLGSFTAEGAAGALRLAADPRVGSRLTGAEHASLCGCMDFAAPGASVAYAYETVRRLKAEGVPIIVGSDAVGPGLGTAYGVTVHHEMRLLVNECGFSPREALTSATSVSASMFRLSDRGQISEGLRADLLLVEGNPLEDIDATLNIRGVWREGVLARGFDMYVAAFRQGYLE